MKGDDKDEKLKALKQMQERLKELQKLSPAKRFEHFVATGLIDSEGRVNNEIASELPTREIMPDGSVTYTFNGPVEFHAVDKDGNVVKIQTLAEGGKLRG